MRSSGEIRGEERRQLIEPLDHRNSDACGRGRALPVEPYGGDAGAAWRQHVVVQVVAHHEHLSARDGEPRYDGVPEPRLIEQLKVKGRISAVLSPHLFV